VTLSFFGISKDRKQNDIVNVGSHGQETSEWKKLMRLLKYDKEFTQRLNSLITTVTFIRIDDVQVDHKTNNVFIPKDYLTEKKQRDDTSLTICHEMIDMKYDSLKAKNDVSFLFKPVFDVEYLNKNFKSGACFLSMILEAYSTSWNDKRPSSPFTYEYLQDLFQISDSD
jgi:hypothetical protein